MIKTVENKFFEPFKPGGIVQRCIEYVREKYNLYPDTKVYQNRVKENTDWSDIQKDAQDAIQVLGNIDDAALTPLFDEIEYNLNECRSDEQRERYVILSLLKPFTTCGLAELLFPLSKLEYLVDCIDEQKQYLVEIPETIRYENPNENEILELIEEETNITNDYIAEWKAEFEWFETIGDKLNGLIDELISKQKKDYNAALCLSFAIGFLEKYGKRLDYLLLSFAISIDKMQNISGFYVIQTNIFSFNNYVDYFGSERLVTHYFESIFAKDNKNGDDDTYSTYYDKYDNIKLRFRGEKPQTDNAPSSRENVLQSNKRPGRPPGIFERCFIDVSQRQWQLEQIKKIAKGKIGNSFIIVIKAAIELHWIFQPTYSAIVNEFGNVCSRQNYDNKIKCNKFRKEDIESIKAALLGENITNKK